MTDIILVNKENNLATITLNRVEKRNALNGPMIATLLQQLRLCATDVSIRVVLIKNNGDDFCAGGDIDWMRTIAKSSNEENVADAHQLSELMFQLYHFPKPTLVLVKGAVLGGGLGIVAACDLALAATNASFGFSEVKLGLVPSTISPYVLAAMGERAARYYFLTGERFDAVEAKQMGLIHQLVEPALLTHKGDEIAKRLLENGPKALQIAKQLIHRVTQEKITPELAQALAKHLAELRRTNEAQEGLNAFMEKRKPNWE